MNSKYTSNDQILTLAEAVSLLKIPKQTLYKLVQKGRIPAIKVGRHWRFQRSIIEKMFEVKKTLPSLRILAIDDEPTVLELLSRVFGRMGHFVRTCKTGEDAIAFVKASLFDLAFIDIRLPGMNGVETLKVVKATSPTLKAVMMTAFDIPDLVREAIREGATTCIYKPFALSQVIGIAEQTDVVEFFEKEVTKSLKYSHEPET